MLTTLTVTTPPAIEPVWLGLAKRHCRIDSDADDTLIPSYITAARVLVETYLSRVLITQTMLWTVTPQGRLPPHRQRLRGTLELPRAPVQSIASVTITDTLGNSTAITKTALPVIPPATLIGWMADLFQSPARIVIGRDTPLTGGGLTGATEIENVQISFVAGYGTGPAAIPQPIIQAILLLVGFFYEHRGDSGGEMPAAVERLLDPYRLMFVV